MNGEKPLTPDAALPSPRSEDLTEAERLRRIGELIGRGIMRSRLLRDESNGRHAQNVVTGSVVEGAEEPRQRIVALLQRTKEASPAEIRVMLKLSRSGTDRALQRLRAEQRVVASGRTSSVVYRLKEFDPSRN